MRISRVMKVSLYPFLSIAIQSAFGTEGLVKINTDIPYTETQIPEIYLSEILFNGRDVYKRQSKRLANNMKDTFESKYGKHQPNRGFSGTVSGRNLYCLLYTSIQFIRL